jgi:hypothetical protein
MAGSMPVGGEAAIRRVLGYSLRVVHSQGRLPPSLLLTRPAFGRLVFEGRR